MLQQYKPHSYHKYFPGRNIKAAIFDLAFKGRLVPAVHR